MSVVLGESHLMHVSWRQTRRHSGKWLCLRVATRILRAFTWSVGDGNTAVHRLNKAFGSLSVLRNAEHRCPVTRRVQLADCCNGAATVEAVYSTAALQLWAHNVTDGVIHSFSLFFFCWQPDTDYLDAVSLELFRRYRLAQCFTLTPLSSLMSYIPSCLLLKRQTMFQRSLQNFESTHCNCWILIKLAACYSIFFSIQFVLFSNTLLCGVHWVQANECVTSN